MVVRRSIAGIEVEYAARGRKKTRTYI